jgi:hypothetical protein
MVVDDARELATGHIAGRQFRKGARASARRRTGGEGALRLLGVLAACPSSSFVGLMLIGALALFVLGNVLAAVFQLAHCVEANCLRRWAVRSTRHLNRSG